MAPMCNVPRSVFSTFPMVAIRSLAPLSSFVVEGVRRIICLGESDILAHNKWCKLTGRMAMWLRPTRFIYHKRVDGRKGQWSVTGEKEAELRIQRRTLGRSISDKLCVVCRVRNGWTQTSPMPTSVFATHRTPQPTEKQQSIQCNWLECSLCDAEIVTGSILLR